MDKTRLTKKEWQLKYGFTDAEMIKIEEALKVFNGKIIEVKINGN